MIDSNDTTFDWQTHAGRIIVGAVGSMEQHGRHMPLATDTLQADYFARELAGELDAALLPTLPYGTCLEHGGFRGSFTLRPETLMQIVRDLAYEIEGQNFTRWVLLNGHGGNFCLGPVVRDINRKDQSLKILLVNWYDFADHAPTQDHAGQGREIHCGEFETSVTLAIAPDLVKPERTDMPSHLDEAHPLQQPDLNTFGVGHFSPEGAVGWPSLASREKGETILKEWRQRAAVQVRDRLRRLDEMPRYAGRGGVALRRMGEGDLPAAMRLCGLAGWNQLEADWRIFLESHPEGCFVAVHQGRVAGTVATVNYANRCAWISMVLVDPDFRRMGIATRLMHAAIESLGQCECVKLDATPAGKHVYDRLGFVEEFRIRRLAAPSVGMDEGGPGGAQPLEPADLDDAVALDAQAFGTPRPELLRTLLAMAPELAWQYRENGELQAVCFGRPGSNYHQVGPVAANSPESAQAVLGAALATLRGRPATLDAPEARQEPDEWLAERGFREERPFIRMFRGENATPGDLAKLYAIAGPELG